MIRAPDFAPFVRSLGSVLALLERSDVSAGTQQAIIEFGLLFAKDRPGETVILSLPTGGTDEQAVVVEPSKLYLDLVAAVARQLQAQRAEVEVESFHGWPVLSLRKRKSDDAP